MHPRPPAEDRPIASHAPRFVFVVTAIARGGMFGVMSHFWNRLRTVGSVEVVAQGPLAMTPPVRVREVPAQRGSTLFRYPDTLVYGTRMFLACLAAVRDGQGPAVLLAQDSLATGLATILAGRLTRTPVVIMEHGTARAIESDFFWNVRMAPLRMRDRLARPMLRATLWIVHRLSLRLLDVALLPSQEAIDHYRRLGVPHSRILTYHVPIDIARFRPGDAAERAETRRRLGLPAEATIILSVGRLTPEKGTDLLIEAVERLPAATRSGLLLVIAGEGRLRSTLEARAAGSAVSVRMAGAVSDDDLPALLRAADLFVYAARQGSNVPVSTLEAMASGLAVVATTEPIAHRETLAEGRGTAIPAEDVAAMTQAIGHYLDHPAARAAAGELARRWVERHHGPAVFEREVDELVGRLGLARRRAPQAGGSGSQST